MSTPGSSSVIFKIGVGVYLAAALVFFVDLIGEITGVYLFKVSWLVHELIELATMVGFLVGALLLWRSNHQLTVRNQEVERHLQAAQGEFFTMLNLQFDRWGLSNAERDVAMLTVKGLSVAEIAELRETSQGTIKSQNNAIYRKADVKSRTQLVSALIEDLLVVE